MREKTQHFIGRDSIEAISIDFTTDEYDDGSVELRGGGVGLIIETSRRDIMFDLSLDYILKMRDMFNDLVDELEEARPID
jgi:hypothetical protein